jgi:tetratricopeptide (TPR) repeat protein
LYTQALEVQQHESIYSNRAASFIAVGEYSRAISDCQAAIQLKPDFQRIYKRLFQARLSIGQIQEAKEALRQA